MVVLKLIGTNNQLIAPPALRELGREYPGLGYEEVNGLEATWHKMRQMWSNKNELYLGHGQINKQPFLSALLGHCSDSAGNTDSWESWKKQLGAAVKQGACSMDAAQFDKLIRNMSQLLDAGEAPVILSVERNITRLEPGHLSVMVGGLVEAALGATMAIWCPVRGVGQPNVSWWKRGGSLGDNVSLLFNGSLLQNVSLRSEGTYVCRASNALGKPVAASTLRFLGQRWPDSKLVFSKDHKNHTLQASSPGNGSSDAIRKPLSPE
ncbi:ADAMTS-like protein 3 isoform X2 [Manis javanica]|uniref:ADAMTS-like protein 3 isoform X2 n=1 Tax=Manis javanica TaxID=9974 RepID=UPI003C6DB49D